ncbi:MAG: hypothetical protein CMJ48_13785 [Planctomycetaceae bacterium]|nr:hypothetical protein [Planctomycetaceae bacterium]
MAVVGVLVRIDTSRQDEIEIALAQFDGATLFPVDEPGQIGLLLEADTTEEAFQTLQCGICCVPGVLGTWPVFSHLEPGADPQPHFGQASREQSERPSELPSEPASDRQRTHDIDRPPEEGTHGQLET